MLYGDATGGKGGFRHALRDDFHRYLVQEGARFPSSECLRIDLHCHDRNSDVPDELWGRILRLPETWLETDRLLEVLQRNGCDVVTVTNHNNARSCWDLLEAGVDVLTGAEFTCRFEEHDLFLHVLAYGFDRDQEVALERRRTDIHDFLRYANENGIPTVLPHPLYFYTPAARIDLSLFEKLAVMFQRFEVLNGQRDLWQSVLTLRWVQGLDPEEVRRCARVHRMDPREYGVDPDRPKVLTGGSDDHMGILAGTSGSRLHVPNLRERLRFRRASALALEALREGRVSPYGHVAENQKLGIALIDYFSQVATRIEDPGLLRIALHRGETRDKLACLAIGNLLLEVRRHRSTRRFFDLIHEALHGRRPSRLLRWTIPKDYRFCLEHLDRIAASAHGSPLEYVETVSRSVSELFRELTGLILTRLRAAAVAGGPDTLRDLSTEELIRKFEIPAQFTSLFFGEPGGRSDMSSLDVRKVLDSLSFPVFMNLVLAGATFASARVLYANRDFLDSFAENLGCVRHERRALWLTDTLRDRNGVSNSLSGKLAEIRRLDLPIDFLICDAEAQAGSHLEVVRPCMTFTVREFGEQEFRIPDLLEIAAIFYRGGYDRIVCSTEGPMALVALFLQAMFHVPCHFFMHTDWLDFARHVTGLSHHERDRIRRVLRALYRQFDGIFVLNGEHGDWLAGHEMQIDAAKVHRTAHHAQPRRIGVRPAAKSDLFPDADADTPVLLIACRLSREKGLLELPTILFLARERVPGLRLVVAGEGPLEAELREALPDACFTGWVDPHRLAELYLGLDLFVFPSRFDTFGNVLLEALTYGMPVVAYDCKGPRDILSGCAGGYLVQSVEEMADRIADHFESRASMRRTREAAVARAAEYRPEPILRRFLEDLGLPWPAEGADAAAVRHEDLDEVRSVA